MTKGQIIKTVKQKEISFIYLQFSDILGQIKNVVIDANKLSEVLENGIWFDGSSVEGFARIAESDMLLKPDIGTFAIIPWSAPERRAARLICNIYRPSGKRLIGDPRLILEKVINRARKMGWEYYTGVEFEFYLIERTALPNLKPHDHKSYFDYTPHSRAAAICEMTMSSLRAFAINNEMHHHEMGPGQHEIDTRYDLALKSADNILSLKMTLKANTSNTELKATWMPKPITGMPGNGLHVHQSLWKDGKNAFYNRRNNYYLSNLALSFLAGQLKHAKAISAIVSPTVNSYKRLVSGFEAPVYICWGRTNRSALIRIPQSSEKKASVAARMEYRAPDPSSNPYLTLAALLTAGLDGIEKKMTPPTPIEENVYRFNHSRLTKNNIEVLPESLGKAIEALENDPIIMGIFGPVADRYLTAKKTEWKQFLTQVTDWEIKKYL